MPNSASSFGIPYIFEFPITNTAKFDQISVEGDTSVDIQPPSGEEWCFTAIRTYGDGGNAGYAQMTDGTNSASQILEPLRGIGEGNENNSSLTNARIFCNNSIYIKIHNDKNGFRDVAYDAFLCKRSGNKGEVVSDVVAVLADTEVDVTPPSGEIWLLTTATIEGDGALSGTWSTQDAGFIYSFFLNIVNSIGDGDLTMSCIHNIKIFGDENRYYHVNYERAVDGYFSYSAIRWQ